MLPHVLGQANGICWSLLVLWFPFLSAVYIPCATLSPLHAVGLHLFQAPCGPVAVPWPHHTPGLAALTAGVRHSCSRPNWMGPAISTCTAPCVLCLHCCRYAYATGPYLGSTLAMLHDSQMATSAAVMATPAWQERNASLFGHMHPRPAWPYHDDAFQTIMQWLYSRIPDTR